MLVTSPAPGERALSISKLVGGLDYQLLLNVELPNVDLCNRQTHESAQLAGYGSQQRYQSLFCRPTASVCQSLWLNCPATGGGSLSLKLLD